MISQLLNSDGLCFVKIYVSEVIDFTTILQFFNTSFVESCPCRYRHVSNFSYSERNTLCESFSFIQRTRFVNQSKSLVPVIAGQRQTVIVGAIECLL